MGVCVKAPPVPYKITPKASRLKDYHFERGSSELPKKLPSFGTSPSLSFFHILLLIEKKIQNHRKNHEFSRKSAKNHRFFRPFFPYWRWLSYDHFRFFRQNPQDFGASGPLRLPRRQDAAVDAGRRAEPPLGRRTGLGGEALVVRGF